MPTNLKSINPTIKKFVSPLKGIFERIDCSIPFTTCNSSTKDKQICFIEKNKDFYLKQQHHI